MNKILTVTVTGDKAILKKGTVAKVMDTGKGFWLVLEVGGRKSNPMTLFLVEGRDFDTVLDAHGIDGAL